MRYNPAEVCAVIRCGRLRTVVYTKDIEQTGVPVIHFGTDTSTLYMGDGSIVPLVVKVTGAKAQ